MTQIHRLQQAFLRAKDRKRASRVITRAIDDIESGNHVETIEHAVIEVVKRIDAQTVRREQAKERRGGQPLTSKQAAAFLDVCRSSLSMLVNGGHVQPSNPDAPNGAPHKFDRAHLQNFLDLNSAGEIRRMIADYRMRPRTKNQNRAADASTSGENVIA